MNYKFNVNITQDDFFEFNKVVMFETKVGKKLLKLEKLFFALFCLIFALVVLVKYEFSIQGIIAAVLLVVVFFGVGIITKPLNNFILKFNVKSISKLKGKKPYTEKAVLEFYDDVFIEITDENKNEVKYSAIENVFVNEKIVLVFINGMEAYILPTRSFETNEQKSSFVEFLNSKR